MEKKLYKIEDGKKIDGVCGGIAEYFNVDVNLIRIIWIIATLCSVGLGVLAYLACAILLPTKSEVI